MAGCCASESYERVFDPAEAARCVRQYRRKGLDPTARRMVDFLRGRGIEGQTVLEIGGGIGAIQLELLRAGAARVVNVELSRGYEAAAQELFEEAGVQERVERHVLDFARQGDTIGPADVVILHRVVCCYPDQAALVGAAAGHARRFLALSFPPDRWYLWLALWSENLWQRLTRSGFRAYLHPPAAILAIAHAHGFRAVLNHRGWIWQAVVLDRAV